MDILLTGASGFLGAHIRKKLQDKSNTTLTCINRTPLYSDTEQVFDLASDQYDILPRAETIIHAAQTRNYSDFNNHAPDVFKVNIESTFKLLEHAVKVKADHYIYISTGSVYENHASDWIETENLRPISANGTTKYIAEQITS